MKRNGSSIGQNGRSGNPHRGRTIPLADGRYAILHNETRPEDGQTYLVGAGEDQNFRVCRVRTTGSGFELVPEDVEPVGIEPKLLMLFRVVEAG